MSYFARVGCFAGESFAVFSFYYPGHNQLRQDNDDLAAGKSGHAPLVGHRRHADRHGKEHGAKLRCPRRALTIESCGLWLFMYRKF